MQARPTFVCTTDGSGEVRQLPVPSVEAVAWGPDGTRLALVQNRNLQIGTLATIGSTSVLRTQVLGRPGEEDVFPFRAQWLSENELLYTADGAIKRRTIGASRARTIPFTAHLSLQRDTYEIAHRRGDAE